MAIPIITVIIIPIFFGLVYVSPFELPEEEKTEFIPEEPNLNILYFILFTIWIIFLARILIQVKIRQFRFAQKY